MVNEPRRDFCFVEQLGLIDGAFREAREGITSTSQLRRNTRRQCYWLAFRSMYFDGAQYISPCGSLWVRVASSVRIIQAALTPLNFTFSSRRASSSTLLLVSTTPLPWVGHPLL